VCILLTDLETPGPRPADANAAVSPPSCEQLRREAEERPKSPRLLPRITGDAVRLVWAAAPRLLIASIGLKLLNGAGLAAALVFGRDLVGSVLSADASGNAPGTAAVAPQLFTVVAIVAGLGLVTAAGREVREILSETLAPRRWSGRGPGVGHLVDRQAVFDRVDGGEDGVAGGTRGKSLCGSGAMLAGAERSLGVRLRSRSSLLCEFHEVVHGCREFLVEDVAEHRGQEQ
jgi:hypothetical protein